MKRETWFGGRERRKVLAEARTRKLAEALRLKLARKHKASMSITERDGRWIVFRARNRA